MNWPSASLDAMDVRGYPALASDAGYLFLSQHSWDN